jgi:16S rRNA (guanine527-N7)-methyltransferase
MATSNVGGELLLSSQENVATSIWQILDAGHRISNVLGNDDVCKLLVPFDLQLGSGQIDQIATYLELLLRWNKKINLTAIRTPEECVTRHFGESLYLGRTVALSGTLLDVGSGAGFPGLALRIVFPQLLTTLLEPVAKKRAFLKEAARACGIAPVDVRPERLDDFIAQCEAPRFDTITARAVGRLDRLIPQALEVLKPGGKICLWVSRAQTGELDKFQGKIQWGEPIRLPLGREREIWVGKKVKG